MRRLVIPSVIVLIVAAVAVSLGMFTDDRQAAAVSDSEKECTRVAVAISAEECGDKLRTTMASNKKTCSDEIRATMTSNVKECGDKVSATMASEDKACGDKARATMASSRECGTKTETAARHASAGEMNRE